MSEIEKQHTGDLRSLSKIHRCKDFGHDLLGYPSVRDRCTGSLKIICQMELRCFVNISQVGS